MAISAALVTMLSEKRKSKLLLRHLLLAFFLDRLSDILWNIADQVWFSHCSPLGEVDSGYASRISLKGKYYSPFDRLGSFERPAFWEY